MSVENKGGLDTKLSKKTTFENKTISSIESLYSTGEVKSKFSIGEKLSEYKSSYSIECYKEFVQKHLPFEVGQADKYRSIWDTEWARNLVFNEDKGVNFPSTFSFLYKLSTSKTKQVVVEAFRKGEYTRGVDGEPDKNGNPTTTMKTFKTSHLTTQLFEEVFGEPKSKKVDKSLTDNKSEGGSDSSTSNDNDTPKGEKLVVVQVSIDTSKFVENYSDFQSVYSYLKEFKLDNLEGVELSVNSEELDNFKSESFTKTSEKFYLENLANEHSIKQLEHCLPTDHPKYNPDNKDNLYVA